MVGYFQFVVPQKFREDVIRIALDSFLVGHIGIQRTVIKKKLLNSFGQMYRATFDGFFNLVTYASEHYR